MVSSSADGVIGPHRLRVEEAPPEHMGLGTGTQLALAVAKALATSAGLARLNALDLARRVGRGNRSGLGIHGFEQGGFLIDGGKGDSSSIAPLIIRHPFPEDWRIVLVVPPWGQGLHGGDEGKAFALLGAHDFHQEAVGKLCGLVLLGLLPALLEHDLQAFGEALYEFNRRVGAMFAGVQGGLYTDKCVDDLVSFVRRQGVRGVGQSSWGPATFAVVGDANQADSLVRVVRAHFNLSADQVFSTLACNHGAKVETVPE
jgi:beta-RFAP synthase